MQKDRQTYLTKLIVAFHNCAKVPKIYTLMFVVCLVGVWQRNFEPEVCVCVCVFVCVCVYGTMGWELLS